ncbi:MAG: sugar transferase [Actinomycetota bacterium]|nr:sugar transferase [Actinomycetota bacterium]
MKSRYNGVVKVVFDKALSTILIFVTSPLWVLISLAILAESLLSPAGRGGLFHSEVRVSAGRPFDLYKFRILKAGGERAIKAGAVPKAVENDPMNSTKVGWALKKFGLDELPQLLNILSGRMSFVGPRPKPVAEYEAEIERGRDFRARLRAGLTGPVQVMKGTSRTEDDQVRADFAYAELLERGTQLRILAFDIKILFKTLLVMLKATGE